MTEIEKWDGTERRQPQESTEGLRDGRRETDWHCHEHHIIQETTREHRAQVCLKLKGLKADTENDITEIKQTMAQKATQDEIKGLAKLISVLVGICCLVMAGMGGWLLMGMRDVKTDAIAAVHSTNEKLDSGFSTMHRRITETQSKIDANAEVRIANDTEQIRQLEKINGEIKTFNWRLEALEKSRGIKTP